MANIRMKKIPVQFVHMMPRSDNLDALLTLSNNEMSWDFKRSKEIKLSNQKDSNSDPLDLCPMDQFYTTLADTKCNSSNDRWLWSNIDPFFLKIADSC